MSAATLDNSAASSRGGASVQPQVDEDYGSQHIYRGVLCSLNSFCPPRLMAWLSDFWNWLSDLWQWLWENPREEAFVVDNPPNNQERQVVQSTEGRRSFFALLSSGENIPPSEGVRYYDTPTGERYFQPNTQGLFAIALERFSAEDYRSICFSKHVLKWKNPNTQRLCPCDGVFFKKKEDQITYERSLQGKVSVFWQYWCSDKAYLIGKGPRARMVDQQKALDGLDAQFVQQVKKFGYSCFQPCGEKQLREHGFEEERAEIYHAVLFFYHKVPENGQM